MEFFFLGTSSGTPTRQRNVTGLGLRFEQGGTWIIDCGEGTQHRILATDIKPGAIDVILITHLHGDHCYGLPGLLAAITVHERGDRPVHIVGPKGIKTLAETVMRVCQAGVSYPIHYHELSEHGDSFEFDHISVTARPLTHRVPCFGYSIREPDFPGRLDAAAAALAGVRNGPDFGKLAKGEDVTLDDGRMVRAADLIGPARRGRHAVVLGDTCNSDAIAAAARGCDVLVHECTYDQTRDSQAMKWQHSTSAMTAEFAKKIEAKHLILTHFSSRYTGTDDGGLGVEDLAQEASAICEGTTVHCANDLHCATLSRPEHGTPTLSWIAPEAAAQDL